MNRPAKYRGTIVGIVMAALLVVGLPLLLATVASNRQSQDDTQAIAIMLQSSGGEPVLVADENMLHELEPLLGSQVSLFDQASIASADKFWVLFWRQETMASPEDYGLPEIETHRLHTDIAVGRYAAFELEKIYP